MVRVGKTQVLDTRTNTLYEIRRRNFYGYYVVHENTELFIPKRFTINYERSKLLSTRSRNECWYRYAKAT